MTACRSFLSRHILLSLIALGAVGISGCDSSNKTSSGNKAASDAGVRKTQCDGILSSLLGKFEQPQVIMNFDAEQAESLLNQWRRSCLQNAEKVTPDAQEKWAALLSPEKIALLKGDVYTKRDAEYLQTSIWMHVLEQVVNSSQTSDLARAKSTFDYVVRSIALVPSHPEDTPLSLKGVVIAGEGTVEDRIYLFSEILRQLKIDVVVISPPATQEQQEQEGALPRSLIAVLLDNEAYLFDPLIGVAVPTTTAPLKSLADENPATWKQVIANPQLLRRMDLPNLGLDLNEKNLSQCRVRLIGQTSVWAPRLADLRDHFSGSFGTYIYDDLVDSGDRKGLLTRVLDAAGKAWKREQISVWSYPEKQLNDRANLNSLQKQFVEKIRQLYRLPLTRNIESKDQNQSFNDPTGAKGRDIKNNSSQWSFEESSAYFQARGQQIMGRFDDAVKTQMLNQRSCRFVLYEFPGPRQPLPMDDPRTRESLEQFRRQFEQLKGLHSEILENAVYWLGTIKYEQKTADDRRIAADKFEQYLREYPEGIWSAPCRMALAMEKARGGNQDDAIARLKEIPATSPYAPVAQWWIREWAPPKPADQKPAPKEPEKKSEPEKKPEDKKPTEKKPEPEKNSEPEKKPADEKKPAGPPPTEAPKTEAGKTDAPKPAGEKKP